MKRTPDQRSESGTTMEAAISQLKDFTPFLDTYRENYLLISSKNITGEQMLNALVLLLPVANGIASFMEEWEKTSKSGPDALIGKMDLDLVKNGKLDMEQFGVVIRRMRRLDELLPSFLRVRLYLDDLKAKYAAKPPKDFDESFRLMYLNLNDAIDHLTGEREDLNRLVERCNLFYQTRTSQVMVGLQVASLVGAGLAIAIAILALIQH